VCRATTSLIYVKLWMGRESTLSLLRLNVAAAVACCSCSFGSDVLAGCDAHRRMWCVQRCDIPVPMSVAGPPGISRGLQASPTRNQKKHHSASSDVADSPCYILIAYGITAACLVMSATVMAVLLSAALGANEWDLHAQDARSTPRVPERQQSSSRTLELTVLCMLLPSSHHPDVVRDAPPSAAAAIAWCLPGSVSRWSPMLVIHSVYLF
jgi:hypothetical protein